MINDDVNNFYNRLYYGKAISSHGNKSVVVGVIDSSESMTACWPTLVEQWNMLITENESNICTILFADYGEEITTKYLEHKHVGGITDICAGFEIATKKISELSSKFKDFTIIFISDGEDEKMATIETRIKKLPKIDKVNINFICMGIGSEFPTFLALELRAKYHSGLSTIPAVFLVNDYQSEIEQNLCQISKEYLSRLDKLTINPSVKCFPWSSREVDEIYETSLFISWLPQVEINGEICQNKKSEELSKEDLEEMFRSWTQEIQILSVKENVRSEANTSVMMMEYLYNVYISQTKAKGDKCKLTLLERIELSKMRTGTHILQALIGECKRVRDGISLSDLTPQEAAKRLAIGTKQGKFHHKALRMKGLKTEEYNQFKEDFLDKLSKCHINPETKQEPSFMLLQSQKEIFLDTTLPEAIAKCNPFELVESFPVIGHTLLIKRSDASLINPYMVNVISIPKINKVCDTISLVSQGNEMEISIGNSEEETFNAVCPLFEASDSDIASLLRSKLYHLLMTFNVMRNVDTFFYDAYLGLLANTLVRLIKYPPSEWRETMIDLVYSTAEMVYGGNPKFEESLSMLTNDPRGAMVTEHKATGHKCEDISKVVLCLLVLKKRKVIVNPRECSMRIIYMLIEHTGRIIKDETNVFEEFNGNDILQDFKDGSQDIRLQKKTTKESIICENEAETVTITSSDPPIDINSLEPTQDIIIHTDINLPEMTYFSSLKEIIQHCIETNVHLKFDSLRDLKKNLRKVFSNFSINSKVDKSLNLKLNEKKFNHPESRINFLFFYFLYDYFCPELEELDSRIFWIAVNHALKYKSSNERSQYEINFHYSSARQQLKQSYFNKSDKDHQENLYESFEKPIIESYLTDHKNALNMIKCSHCTTGLLRICAKYDPNKPCLSIAFFGPQGCGKSSVIGRLMKECECIDQNMFEHYKTSYKTFHRTRNNYPYEWITDTAADERCKGQTMNINVSHLNTRTRFIQICDTPGKYSYYKQALSALYLVDHVFLCVEAHLEKIQDEIEIIKHSISTLGARKCCKLYIIVTKLDKYEIQDEVSFAKDVEEYFMRLFESMKVSGKIQCEAIGVSAYTGKNIQGLIALMESLEKPKLEFRMMKKLLVMDTIGDDYKKVIYGQVLNGPIIPTSSFTCYPSMMVGKVKNIQINYTPVTQANTGQFVTIELNHTSKSLSITKGSILHVDAGSPIQLTGKDKTAKIKELNAEVRYFGTTKCKVNSLLILEFAYFRKTFQIKEMKDGNGDEIKGDLPVNTNVFVKFVPTSEIYFEMLRSDQEKFVIRGRHHKTYGYGRLVNGLIIYNFK